MRDIIRNERGQFVKGNPPKHPRDNKGRFLSEYTEELSKYEHTRKEVDKLLNEADNDTGL